MPTVIRKRNQNEMHVLAALMTERLSSGLKRKSIVRPSQWAEAYREMGPPYPGRWSFKRHPWLRGMHDSEAEFNVGQKAAQMGFTETVLNIVFYHIDIHGVDCLYVLPAKTPDASDFSAARFDPAIESSPHLGNIFTDVKNVGHKRAGQANLYIRGSKSRAGLKSVPVGVLVLDEKDEMRQENIPLARERLSGYSMALTWEISTPTVDDKGINTTFKTSTQEEFFFQCPGCGKHINLEFPRNYEICGEHSDDPDVSKSFLKCHLCNKELVHDRKWEFLANGIWVPKFKEKTMRGFGISQMYSSAKGATPSNFIKAYFLAQTNPADEQEFHNSKLGVPHIVDGAKLTDADLRECMGGFLKRYYEERSDRLITMGVDVGNWLHYEIDMWRLAPDSVNVNTHAKPSVILEGKCRHFEELDALMDAFKIKHAVIDSQPEKRKAREFAERWFGKVHMCQYSRGIAGKQIHVNEEELTVSVDRTSWLDLSLSRFRSKMILLPKDLSNEYKEHLKALVRIYEKDSDGNLIGKYVKGDNNHDHFAHSRNYAEIALPLAVSVGVSQNMESPA